MQKRLFSLIIFIFFLVLSGGIIVSQKFLFISNTIDALEKYITPLQESTYVALAQANSGSTEATNQQKLVDLQLQIDQLKSDNAALKDQFATEIIPSTNLLPAHIIGMPRFLPGLSKPETIVIDQGKEQGVKIGTVVVLKNMLVGKVTSVQPNLAVVSLLTNPDISFTARTLTGNADGIVHGLGGGKADLENVLLSDNLQTQDTIVTKGDIDANGQGFPPELVVGTLSKINKTPSALFQTATIIQPFDITRVNLVFLLLHP
ncbi:MAG TPA: rod shape-determining protein MreC [Patescibacteria group bacterium]|nr:rod shape-determining protein MreC [Patescibacteria group bacterium]